MIASSFYIVPTLQLSTLTLTYLGVVISRCVFLKFRYYTLTLTNHWVVISRCDFLKAVLFIALDTVQRKIPEYFIWTHQDGVVLLLAQKAEIVVLTHVFLKINTK